MKKGFIFKIAVDVLMTVLLLLLMARQITGDAAHEWLGAGLFVLWLAHHIMNRNWYSHLFKGRYTLTRILQTAADFAVLLPMFGLMVSGIILSREVFTFISIPSVMFLVRQIHILSAFWGFVLMAFHLGLHWNMILGMVGKAIHSVSSKAFLIISRIAAGLIAGYGLYAFVKNQFLTYMFLKSHFVFFDFERSAVFFFTEYIAIMGLFIFLAHYLSKEFQKLTKKGKDGI
ncbi:MAG: DUF4405 domain-containing protein [Acetatifactor muris]|nr:DUF4405 domain-containing protein [Acetatifactor muris]